MKDSTGVRCGLIAILVALTLNTCSASGGRWWVAPRKPPPLTSIDTRSGTMTVSGPSLDPLTWTSGISAFSAESDSEDVEGVIGIISIVDLPAGRNSLFEEKENERF